MARTSYATRIKSRIAELEQVIASATAELNELRVAEKVLDRFSASEDEGSAEAQSLAGAPAKEKTIPEQIIDILKEYGPLDTAAIFQHINEVRSTPTSHATVQSTLSRIKASNRLGHDGARWHVIKEDSAQHAPQTNEAPEGASTVWD